MGQDRTDERPPGRGPVGDIIKRANDAGVSYRTMSKRSSKDSKGLSSATFQRLAEGEAVKPLDYEGIAAVALATGRPLREVQEAAAKQWLRYEATEVAGYDADVRRILVIAEGMDPLARKRLAAMLEAAEQVDRDPASHQ